MVTLKYFNYPFNVRFDKMFIKEAASKIKDNESWQKQKITWLDLVYHWLSKTDIGLKLCFHIKWNILLEAIIPLFLSIIL